MNAEFTYNDDLYFDLEDCSDIKKDIYIRRPVYAQNKISMRFYENTTIEEPREEIKIIAEILYRDCSDDDHIRLIELAKISREEFQMLIDVNWNILSLRPDLFDKEYVMFLLKNGCIPLSYIPVEAMNEEMCEIGVENNHEDYLYIPNHLRT
jgi:hypothetical protein